MNSLGRCELVSVSRPCRSTEAMNSASRSGSCAMSPEGTTTATTRSPHWSSLLPITATSSTSGWSSNVASTDCVETFSPPVFTTSFMRSTNQKIPSASKDPMSAECSQPPLKTSGDSAR